MDLDPPANTDAPQTPLPPPVEPPRRSPRRFAIFALLFACGVITGAATAAGVAVARQTSPTASSSSPAATTPPSSGGSSVNPGDSGDTITPAPSSGSSAASSVAAGVDPAVVDITTRLAYSGGQAAGTGIVITSTGEVLTNNHVIAGAATISVQIDGTGPTYTADVVGVDPTDDIALIKIRGVSGLKTVSIGDSSRVTVGQTVVAIGNALGRGGTPAASQGSVTALNQTITAGDSTGSAETLNGLIQIDAAIQPGDSGGPLVDSSGHVIGIDTAAQTNSRSQNSTSTTAFAIPINGAMSIVRQIESGTSSSTVQIGQRAILGVEIRDGTSGAAVIGVQPNTPAASIGLNAGDVITSIDGQSVTSAATLRSALSPHHPGDRVTVGWVDATGQQHSAAAQLIAGPPA